MDEKRANVCHASVVAAIADFGKSGESPRLGHGL
jgi:hypothetical protein